jgi:sulfoxide reductase heme-binding subunit YedZ
MQTLRQVFDSRAFLWSVLALPGLLVTIGYANGRMFYGEVVHETGVYSIRLLLLTLAVTPLRLMFPGRAWTRWLVKRRRYFGVASFVYALLHTVVYAERLGSLPPILADAIDPGMLTGWLALVIFAALAATSNDWSTARLARAWKSLHRTVYAAALLSFAHWVLVAFDPTQAFLHLTVLGGIEGYRVWKTSRPRGRSVA